MVRGRGTRDHPRRTAGLPGRLVCGAMGARGEAGVTDGMTTPIPRLTLSGTEKRRRRGVSGGRAEGEAAAGDARVTPAARDRTLHPLTSRYNDEAMRLIEAAEEQERLARLGQQRKSRKVVRGGDLGGDSEVDERAAQEAFD